MIHSRLVSIGSASIQLVEMPDIDITPGDSFGVSAQSLSDTARNVRLAVTAMFATAGFEPYRGAVWAHQEDFARTHERSLIEFLSQIKHLLGHPNVLHIGIGANDQHMRGLAKVLNRTAEGGNGRNGRIHIASHPGEYLGLDTDEFSSGVAVAISRSGDTQETLRTLKLAATDFNHFVILSNPPTEEGKETIYTLGQKLQHEGKNVLFLPVSRGIGGRLQRRHDLKDKVTLWLSRGDAFVASLWNQIHELDRALAPERGEESIAIQLAAFLRAHQEKGRGHLAIFCDDEMYFLAVELRQFLMEGANRHGVNRLWADIHKLPADSHRSVEGVLGNRDSTMALFILSEKPCHEEGDGVVFEGDVSENSALYALNRGNLERAREVMPTASIILKSATTIDSWNAASTLLEDVGAYYCIASGSNPYDNPEVAVVRARGAALIAEARRGAT